LIKKRKKRISHQESIRLKIRNLEEEIALRNDHFKYIKDTMHLWKNPEDRVVGEDTRRYKKDHPLLKAELRSLKIYYKDKFGEEI